MCVLTSWDLLSSDRICANNNPITTQVYHLNNWKWSCLNTTFSTATALRRYAKQLELSKLFDPTPVFWKYPPFHLWQTLEEKQGVYLKISAFKICKNHGFVKNVLKILRNPEIEHSKSSLRSTKKRDFSRVARWIWTSHKFTTPLGHSPRILGHRAKSWEGQQCPLDTFPSNFFTSADFHVIRDQFGKDSKMVVSCRFLKFGGPRTHGFSLRTVRWKKKLWSKKHCHRCWDMLIFYRLYRMLNIVTSGFLVLRTWKKQYEGIWHGKNPLRCFWSTWIIPRQ